MIKTMTLYLLAAALFLPSGIGLAETAAGTPDHIHIFPYTKVLDEDYYIQMIVEHREDELWLVFEDTSARAVRILPLKTIRAELIFEGGERLEIEFKAVADGHQWTHGRAHPILRLGTIMAGKYVYQADWVKEAGKFDLIVSFPFKDTQYRFAFEYSIGGQMYHKSYEKLDGAVTGG